MGGIFRLRLFVCFVFLVLICNSVFSQLNGSYTIGGVSPDYSTINAAVNALTTNGVAGPVVFNIRSGTYYSQVSIPSISGASEVNRITFQSEQQDSSLVRWKYNSNLSGNNYVILFNGADYIDLKYLSIQRDSLGSTGSRIIRLDNGTSNINILHCNLYGKNSAIGSTSYELVYASAAVDSNIYVSNCTLNGGWYAVNMSGLSSSAYLSRIVFENNSVKSRNGFLLNYYGDVTVKWNTITATESALYFTNGLKNAKVINNKILNNSINYCVYISNHVPATGDSLEIIGNMIRGGNMSTLAIFNSTNGYVFHNSITNTLTSSSNSEAVLKSSSSILTTGNNIFKTTNGVVMNLSGGSVSSDYNIYNTSSSILIKSGVTSYTTLLSYQIATPYDDNSFSSIPNFISNTDLHIVSDLNAHNNGYPVNVGNDLDGDARGLTPDIGADEFQQPANEAGIVGISNVPLKICQGINPIYAKLKNFGTSNLNAVTINWSVNGAVQSPFNWNGNLAIGQIDSTVNIGAFNFLPNGSYTIKAWTSIPNGANDSFTLNDSTTYGVVRTRLSGTYTIGGSSPDFSTINASISEMASRGICGPVDFLLRDGIYNEVIVFSMVDGANSVNTIIYESENSDSSLVKITLGGTDNAGWIISGTITDLLFKNLTILRVNNGSSTAPNLVVFNYSKNILFEKVHFNSGYNYYGTGLTINYSSYFNIHNCIFENLQKGVIKITTPFDSVFIVERNQFRNISNTNISLTKISDSLFVNNNLVYNDTLNVPTGLGYSPLGISLSSAYKAVKVEGNMVMGRFMSGGISLTNINGSASSPIDVINNFSSISSTHSSSCAFYISACNYVNVNNNSFRVHNNPASISSSTIPYAIKFNNSVQANIKYINNCVYADSCPFVYSMATSWETMFSEFDYNNVFIKYPSYTQISNSSTWPSTWNENSISVNPQFNGVYDLHVQNQELAAAIWTNNLKDIDGQTRYNPTIGADEGEFIRYNLACDTLNFDYRCDSVDVYTKVRNIGFDTVFQYTLDGKLNSMQFYTNTFVDTLYANEASNWILLGTLPLIESQLSVFQAYSSNPNNFNDYEHLTDTTYAQFVFNDVGFSLGPDKIICSLDRDTLFVPNANLFHDFEWNNGFTTSFIEVDTTGDYVVSLLNQFGCFHSDTLNVKFGVNVDPNLILINDTIVSSIAGNNQWFLNGAPLGTSNDDTLKVSQIGDYYLMHTDSLGCITFSDTISVNSVYIHTSNDLNGDAISIYPNSSDEELNIDSKDRLNYELVNSSGQLIIAGSNNQNHFKINTSDLANGLYILKLYSTSKFSTHKILVTH